MHLKLENFCAISQGVKLFHPLTYQLDPEKILILTGESGAGKSLCLRTLAGFYHTYCGFYKIDTQSLYMPAFLPFSPCCNLRDVSTLYSYLFQSEAACFLRALKEFDLPVNLNLGLNFLSSGQKQRLYLTALTLSKAPLWLIDEPFIHLDQSAIDIFYRLLTSHLKNKGSAIIASPKPLPDLKQHFKSNYESIVLKVMLSTYHENQETGAL